MATTVPPVVSFLQDIIRIPSLSGKEEQVVRRIAAEMDATGAFDEVRLDALGNVVGRIGDGPLVIMLDAHIDTVDIGDRSQWARDPYGAEIVDGHITGRGAVDEKPALACMLYGAAARQRAGHQRFKAGGDGIGAVEAVRAHIHRQWLLAADAQRVFQCHQFAVLLHRDHVMHEYRDMRGVVLLDMLDGVERCTAMGAIRIVEELDMDEGSCAEAA